MYFRGSADEIKSFPCQQAQHYWLLRSHRFYNQLWIIQSNMSNWNRNPLTIMQINISRMLCIKFFSQCIIVINLIRFIVIGVSFIICVLNKISLSRLIMLLKSRNTVKLSTRYQKILFLSTALKDTFVFLAMPGVGR